MLKAAHNDIEELDQACQACMRRCLEEVDLRENNLLSPPQMVADEGTSAIVAYLDKGTDLGLEQPQIDVSTCGMGWWFLILGVAFYFSDLFSDVVIISQLYSLSYVDRSIAAAAVAAGAGNSSSYIEATLNASIAREIKCQGNFSLGREVGRWRVIRREKGRKDERKKG